MLKRKTKRQLEEDARKCNLDEDTKVGKKKWSEIKAACMVEGFMTGADYVGENLSLNPYGVIESL